MSAHRLRSHFVLLFVVVQLAQAGKIIGRWGHAASYIPASGSNPPRILVHGGKIDPDRSYSYTSAHNTDEMLSFSLAQEVEATDANWVSESGKARPVAWHNMGVFQSDEKLLLFGGDGGVNLPIQTANDSAWSYDLKADWQETSLGVDQPMRRRYAASSTSWDGNVMYITGGEKGDGSGLGFSETWEVRPVNGKLEFLALSTMPDQLVGHKSIMLKNGTLLLIGGYMPFRLDLLPLTTIFSLNTADPSARWQSLLAIGVDIPVSRRSHTAVLVSSSKVIMYGGITGSEEDSTALNDMWELDLKELTWNRLNVADTTKRAVGDPPGGLFDHAAVGIEGWMIMVGGRNQDGAVDDSLFFYDAVSDMWSFTLPAVPTEIAQSYNGLSDDAEAKEGTGQASQTASSGGNIGESSPFSVTATSVLQGSTGTASVVVIVSPETTVITNDAGHRITSTALVTLTSPIGYSPTDVVPDDRDGEGTENSHKMVLAVGSVFGTLGAFAVAVLAWALRRKHQGNPLFGGMRLTRVDPYLTRQAKKRPYAEIVLTDGSEGLMNDYMWDATERLFTPPRKGLRGSVVTPTKQTVSKAFSASANPYSPAHPAIFAHFVDRVRYTSGRGAPRFDILADEDRSDIWRALSLQPNESEAIQSAEKTDMIRTQATAEYKIQHPAVPSSSAGSGQFSDDDIVDTTPASAAITQARRRVSQKNLPDPFEDPVEASYDARTIDRIEQQPSQTPSSSVDSRDFMRNSVMSASLHTATHEYLPQSNAMYLPLKRNGSILKRIADAGASIFSVNRSYRLSATDVDGFLDPTPPPSLDPITEGRPGTACPDTPSPPSVSSRDFSHASMETSTTATSDLLATYGLMDIVRRERTASSREASDPYTEADPTDVLIATGDGTLPNTNTAEEQASTGLAPLRHGAAPNGPRIAPTRHPTEIGLGVRRTVRELADSINRRDFATGSPPVPVPTPMQASAASFALPPPMHSPYRGLGGPRGPRRPTTTYEVTGRSPLIVTNPE